MPRVFNDGFGVRARTAVVSTFVTGLALVIAGIAFVWLQQRSLENALTDLASQQSSVLAANAEAEAIESIDLGAPKSSDAALVQVVDETGVVVASPALAGDAPLSATRLNPGAARTQKVDGVNHSETGRYVLALRGVHSSGRDFTIITAQSLESVDEVSAASTRLLVGGIPLLLIFVAALSWWLTGRALRPVERIRRQVTAITSTDCEQRVSVPASHDEIHQLAITMNDMLERLTSNNRTQRRFVADASHELRSPLASMRLSLDVALAHPGATDWDNTAQDLSAEANRLGGLIDDLLLLARIDEAPASTQYSDKQYSDVDVDDLLNAEAARLRSRDGIEVHVDTPPIRVRGNAGELARAVRNLVDNAERHARRRVHLSAYRDLDAVIIEVADDGPGIAPEDRNRVFERFVRLDEVRGRTDGGAGLGLAIVRLIARDHGGDALISGGPGGVGSTVRIRIDGRVSPDE